MGEGSRPITLIGAVVDVGHSWPGELSQAQSRFAERVDAHPGLEVEAGQVFLYREDDVGCERWLVDRDGRILDFARFDRSTA